MKEEEIKKNTQTKCVLQLICCQLSKKKVLREGTKQDAGGRHEDDKRMTRGTDNFSGESYLEEDSGKKRGTWVSTKKVLGFEDLSSCSCFDYTTAFQLNTIELNR